MCKNEIQHYIRFKDDICLVAKSEQISNILAQANSFHTSIKFTCENMKQNQISFLDRTFKIDERGVINSKHYIKETQTERTIHYNSHQPQCVKWGVVKGEINRTIRRTNQKEEQNAETGRIVSKYVKNGFPANKVKNMCSEAIQQTYKKNINPEENTTRKPITYIDGLTHRVQRVLLQHILKNRKALETSKKWKNKKTN